MTLFSSASTKTPPSVDKCHLRAPYIHTRHPLRGQKSSPAPNFHKKHLLCGQAATISPPRPQKRPHPWTNATCGHHTSTPGTLCVDRRQLFLLRIHKNTPSVDKCHLRAPYIHTRHPQRGQAATPGTFRPQKIPDLWTKPYS